MKAALLRSFKVALWRLVRLAHQADFAWFLPLLGRLPLPLAYALSTIRGRISGATGRDWRSVALGFRHVRSQSLAGYAMLPGSASAEDRLRWCRQRFETEARDEFEVQLVAARRLNELACECVPAESIRQFANRARGLVLLTPHYDSFYLGSAFLARATGARINSMSSAVSRDPRVDPMVTRHFHLKYRSLESYVNGGKVLDMEVGLRPFYRMLERNEILIVLGDAPVLPNGVSMQVDFLGAPRILAGGALRLAQHTNSDLGAYVCRYVRPGRYRLEIGAIGASDDPSTLNRIYEFFSNQILSHPGLWQAADLLPNMPAVSLDASDRCPTESV